jgi:hypothetical protein
MVFSKLTGALYVIQGVGLVYKVLRDHIMLGLQTMLLDQRSSFNSVLFCSLTSFSGHPPPEGERMGQWADGISFAGFDGLVAGNLIMDATDGAIVVFGAPGSLITSNTIITRTRSCLGGICMGDYKPRTFSCYFRNSSMLSHTR